MTFLNQSKSTCLLLNLKSMYDIMAEDRHDMGPIISMYLFKEISRYAKKILELA